MIQVTAQTRVLVMVESIDFRAGIDRLCRICQAQLMCDPFSGTLFVFRNRQATAIKILAYDGQAADGRRSRSHWRGRAVAPHSVAAR